MAKKIHDPFQLDLFGPGQNDRTPDLRPNGGSTLAGALPATGEGIGADRPADGGAPGGVGVDAGRNGAPDTGFSPSGTESPAGPRSGVGAGAGALPADSAGNAGDVDPPRPQHNDRMGRWETADEYLAGNVREKRASRKRAPAFDPTFPSNADSLRGEPATGLNATEIAARFGTVRISVDDVAGFGGRTPAVSAMKASTTVNVDAAPRRLAENPGSGRRLAALRPHSRPAARVLPGIRPGTGGSSTRLSVGRIDGSHWRFFPRKGCSRDLRRAN